MEKKVYGFFTDFLRGEGEQAYGLLTDSYRIWKRSLRIFYGFFTDFLRGEGEQAYGLRIYGVKESRLTDCLRILTGFGREAYGFFTDF